MKRRFNSLILACVLGLLVASCASHGSSPSTSATPSASEQAAKAVDQPIVDDKYRLTKDREAFQEIRKEVPEDKKVENDELAFIMQWMGEVKRPPTEIREKFNSAVTKKRQVFQKDMEKKRTEFVKAERKEREQFTKEQEKKRKDFTAKKPKSEERQEFFGDIETKRRDFYTAQREKRDEFESEMRDHRKNFDDYIRERTSEFNQEHRAYTKRYEDYQKQLKEQKSKPNVTPSASPGPESGSNGQ